MTIVAYEMVDSMSGSVTNESESGEQRDVKRRYLIGQIEGGFNEVVQEMDAYTPEYVTDAGGLYWVRRRLDVSAVGHKYFDCTANYQTLLPKPSASGDPADPLPGSLAWDTSGYTERIYQALGETRYPNDATDFDEAINVNGSTVEGIDKVMPGMRYSETWIFPAAAAFTEAYLGNVHDLTGTVNLDKFRAFDPGEALFMGARCQWQSDQPFCSITFDFECRPNVDAFYVKSLPTFPKLGWEYVWIRYSDAVANDTLVRRPIAAYKNKIYEQRSWFGLLITAGAVGRPVQQNTPSPPRAPRLPAGWNQP